MRTCPNPGCNEPLERGFRACPVCLTQLPPAEKCDSCGEELLPHWKACPFCLTAVRERAGRVPDGELVKKIAGRMVPVTGGEYEMGDLWGEGEEIELPVHVVRVGDFLISSQPVTFEEYDAFCRLTRRELPDDNGWGRGRRPVIHVTWDDATAFCKWLSELSGRQYRLPTEAQWEYAARSGGKREKWSGTNDRNALENYAWYGQNAGGMTQPVGQKTPNGLGLYDMCGNVWEWCSDWFEGFYYKKSPRDDPQGPSGGDERVLRGGAWNFMPSYIRTTYRGSCYQNQHNDRIGFRLAGTP